jgi:hypothetical protein
MKNCLVMQSDHWSVGNGEQPTGLCDRRLDDRAFGQAKDVVPSDCRPFRAGQILAGMIHGNLNLQEPEIG